MRLLNARDVGQHKFTFREFVGEVWPEYAILSHTWEEEEEVIFQDLLTEQAINLARQKAGYAKLERFAALASENSFSWIWMDTCCIDKTSSAELSEAINSMYRWYAEAEICYAYLADVAFNAPGPGAKAREMLTAKVFAISQDRWPANRKIPVPQQYTFYARWFSRGWTLQEMLAPAEVVFFDKDWKRIGMKTSIYPALSEVTGIPGPVIGRFRTIQSYSVAQRMSWASDRITTRVEDEAYSLLGLFDITMPLLYGEGTKAFLRLQQEIIAHADDQSMFAWGSSRPLKHHLGTRTGPERAPSFSGLLAPSIKHFWSTHDVLRLEPFTSDNRVTFTSGRICFPLPLGSFTIRGSKAREQSWFIAVLACTKESDLIGILLQRSGNESSKYFVRAGMSVLRVPRHLLAPACVDTLPPKPTILPVSNFEDEAGRNPEWIAKLIDRGFPGDGTQINHIDVFKLTLVEFAAMGSQYTFGQVDSYHFQLGDWTDQIEVLATWPAEMDAERYIWVGARGVAAIALRLCGQKVVLLLLCWQRQGPVCKLIECDALATAVSAPLSENTMAHAVDRIMFRLPEALNEKHRIRVGPGMEMEASIHWGPVIYKRFERWYRGAIVELSLRHRCLI